MKTLFPSLSLAVLLLMLGSCVAPINSSFESARSLGKKNTELMGAYSHYNANGDGKSESYNNNYGLRVGYGISDRMDMKFRFEYLASAVDDGINATYFEVAPKYALINKWLSGSVPIGVYLYDADGLESIFVVSPKMLFSYPASQKFEVTLGGKLDIYLEEDTESTVGLNLGLAFSSNLDKWALRPEMGVLFDPGEDGKYVSFGLGFTYLLLKNE